MYRLLLPDRWKSNPSAVEEVSDLARDFANKAKQELTQTGSEKIVLSDESWLNPFTHDVPRNLRVLEVLRDSFVRQFGSDFGEWKILIGARRQDQLLSSAYRFWNRSISLSHASEKHFLESFLADSEMCALFRFDAVAAMLDTMFDTQTSIYLYEDALLGSPTYSATLSSAFGVPHEVFSHLPVRNESTLVESRLSRLTGRLADRAWPFVQRAPRSVQRKVVNSYASLEKSLKVEKEASLQRDVRQGCIERFRESNQDLCVRLNRIPDATGYPAGDTGLNH